MIWDRFAVLFVLGVLASAGAAAPPALAQTTNRIESVIAAPPASRPFAALRRRVTVPPIEDTADELSSEERVEGHGDVNDHEDDDDKRVTVTQVPSEEGADAEPQMDGIVLIREPAPVLDGIPDLSRDPRDPHEIAVLRQPAGYDPYLFQIEPEPLHDRRTGELFRLEPYVPVGLRMGSFVVFPELELGALATNNVFRSASRQADIALDVRSNIRVVTDWRAHALEFRAAGVASFYGEHASEDDRSGALEARGRLDITRRTNVEALLSRQLDKDTRSAPNSPAGAAERGDVELDRAAVSLNHRFSRLSFQLRAALSEFDYAPVSSIGGGIISNNERDFTQRDVAVRATWNFGRGLGLFVETSSQDRSYHTAPADGILRSSAGERHLLGFSFGPQSNTIRGEISAGWGRQQHDDGRLSDLQGLLVEANLAWRASALTTFLLTARSDFVDSTGAGSSGALARQVGLQIRHAFYRHLIGTAAIRYTSTPYENIDLTERELMTELGFEYYIGRNTVLFAQYQHICFDSSAPASNYESDIARIGFRVRY